MLSIVDTVARPVMTDVTRGLARRATSHRRTADRLARELQQLLDPETMLVRPAPLTAEQVEVITGWLYDAWGPGEYDTLPPHTQAACRAATVNALRAARIPAGDDPVSDDPGMPMTP